MEFAEKYFNCSKHEIEGIELEELITREEPGCNDDLIHWDARILLGDYKIVFKYVQDQAISKFTLASLEDTGFYEVNYYTGGLMGFGRNTGCDFFTKDFNEPLKAEEIKPNQTTTSKLTFLNEFCSGKRKAICLSGRQSRNVCNSQGSVENLVSTTFFQRNWDNDGNE